MGLHFNADLLHLDEEQVLDYLHILKSHNHTPSDSTLPQAEFIRRYTMHILPKGFVRNRHYRILSSSSKGEKLPVARDQTGQVTVATPEKESLFKICPVCKKGKLVTVDVFDERGPPEDWLDKLKRQKKNKRQRA